MVYLRIFTLEALISENLFYLDLEQHTEAG